MELVFENPLAGDNIGTRRPGNERPSVIVKEGMMLVGHGMTPIGILKGSPICFGIGEAEDTTVERFK